MCCGTNIFINTQITTLGCCRPMIRPCRMGVFSPGCFDYGFCNSPMAGMAAIGVGMGVGMAAGMALPSVIKGIGSACKWTYNNILAPVGGFLGKCAVGLWNGALKPAGNFIGKCAVGAWNGIKSAFSWLGNGIKNLWNKIF